MMTKIHFVLCSVALLFFCGCWTLHQSEYPQIEISKAPCGRNAWIQVTGFESTFTTYTTYHAMETTYCARYYHNRRGHLRYAGMMPVTTSTATTVPEEKPTNAFIDRACIKLEDAGFIVNTTNASHRIHVAFSGPVITNGDRVSSLMWNLCSGFSADYGAQTWSASLRIYDIPSGRLLMKNEYTQKYSAAVWGLIPLFSPAAADETTSDYMQAWCLAVLTDRAIADVSAFLNIPQK